MDYNPNYPEVFGMEWFSEVSQTSRVFAGSAARFQRVISTATETIDAMKFRVAVNPLLKEDTRTLIDIYEEGDEDLGDDLFFPVELVPNSDVDAGAWTKEDGSTNTNLYQQIVEDPNRWPGPAQFTYIQTTSTSNSYRFTVDASEFGSGGDYENYRIGFVELRAIAGANTGYRKLSFSMEIDSDVLLPAANDIRDVHGYGARYSLWYGELNPATGLPWTPADIADFDTGGNSVLKVRSQTATATYFPKLFAMRLVVWVAPETRKAVGVWRRPHTLTTRLNNITTDALISVPDGSAGWSKEADKNYVLCFRQSCAPALWGPVNADDVQWLGGYQDLTAAGQPPGISFPLHTNGTAPAPSTVLASDLIVHDQFGRPERAFAANRRAAYSFVLVDDNGDPSVDSQPYCMDLTDIFGVRTGQMVGQRFTPSETQPYLGVRFLVVPPERGDRLLTVKVHQVSNGAQVGGTFTISALTCRRLPAGPGGTRYVTGFLSEAASLTASTQYEIRFTSDTVTDDWLFFAPNCSLAPTRGFGGTTDGLVRNTTHDTDRDLLVTLMEQPEAPENVTAAIEVVPVEKPDESLVDVEHVSLTWEQASEPLGAPFVRYEVERRLDHEEEWTKIADIEDENVLGFVDYMVPRQTKAWYRVRSIGKDGRFSEWGESNGITPDEGDYDVVLSSNHYPDLMVVLDVPGLQEGYEFKTFDNDEMVQLHGEDLSVVFKDPNDRGRTWTFSAELNFGDAPPVIRSGHRVFGPLEEIARTDETPHVCVMDFQGSKVLGYVKPSGATQNQPGNVYSCSIEVTPTHSVEVPVVVES
jgi:hypothetical protein